MSETIATIARVAILVFVLASMLSLGLSLRVRQILDPLKNFRLVVLGLVANFVIAPLVAWSIADMFGLDEPLTLGLVLLGTAAGAPFLPKLAQLASGDVAYSVGLMVLLMVVTIAFIPLVLVPLMDIDVGAWDIAQPLVFFMLVPLGIALIVRARYEESAKLAPHLNQISTVALALGVGIGLILGLPAFVEAFGTGAFLAAVVFAVLCLVAGFLLGGGSRDVRWVTALGTAQRNISAALLIATTNFIDQPDVLVMVLLTGVVTIVILLPLAVEVGKRTKTARAQA